MTWRVDGFVAMPMPMPMARPPLAATQPAFSSSSHASRSNLALFSSRESTAAELTTYYDVLGVSMYSDTAEIKKQYKRLARMTHPDALIASSSSNAANTSNGSGTDSLPDFYEISTAYKMLSDPKKRKKYDRELAADQFVEGTAELAESVSATLGGFVVPFISNTAKATVKAAAKTPRWSRIPVIKYRRTYERHGKRKPSDGGSKSSKRTGCVPRSMRG